MTPVIRSEYLGCVYDVKKRKEMVSYAVKQLKAIADLFEFFVFRGTSGLLMGPEIAGRLSKPFAVIRKTTDNAHYSREFEGTFIRGGRYIIIDDFIYTGETIHKITEVVSEVDDSIIFVGAYLYKPNMCEGNMIDAGFEEKYINCIGPFLLNWDNDPLSQDKKYAECVTMSNHRERMIKHQAQWSKYENAS